jgi:hypothetical protein
MSTAELYRIALLRVACISKSVNVHFVEFVITIPCPVPLVAELHIPPVANVQFAVALKLNAVPVEFKK